MKRKHQKKVKNEIIKNLLKLPLIFFEKSIKNFSF